MVLFRNPGVHTQHRDEVVDVHSAIPMSDINAQIHLRQKEKEMGTASVVNTGKAESVAKQVLQKLSKASAELQTPK